MLWNEGGSAIAGSGFPVPSGSELPWAWPEVWVNEEDFEIASQMAAEFQTRYESVRSNDPSAKPPEGEDTVEKPPSMS